MAKKAATTRPTSAQLRQMASKMGLLEGKSGPEAEDWIGRVARRADAVPYLKSLAEKRRAAGKPLSPTPERELDPPAPAAQEESKPPQAPRRTSQRQLTQLARRLGLLQGMSDPEVQDWITRTARQQPDPVAYLEARAARQHKARPRRRRELPSRVSNVAAPPDLPAVDVRTILVPLVIGPWHPEGYGVSRKDPPQRLRMPDRRLKAEQAHAIARLFNGAIANQAKLLNGQPIRNKEELVLHVLETISQAIDADDQQTE